MKRDLQLDRSRLLGFKLAPKDTVASSQSPCDPRMGAKIGKVPGSKVGGKVDQQAR